MRRHAWNCDLSTKPGTDILTNRHIYIYISLSLARSPARPTTTRPQPARSPLPRQRSAPHHPKARRNPSPQRRRSLRRDRTRHDQNHPLHHHFPRTGWHKDLMGDPLKTLTRKALHPSELQILKSPLAGSLTITRMPTRSRSTPASARAQTLVGFCQAVSFRLWAQWGLDIHEDRLEIRYQDLDGDTFPGEPL